jgi:hypothetical protein
MKNWQIHIVGLQSSHKHELNSKNILGAMSPRDADFVGAAFVAPLDKVKIVVDGFKKVVTVHTGKLETVCYVKVSGKLLNVVTTGTHRGFEVGIVDFLDGYKPAPNEDMLAPTPHHLLPDPDVVIEFSL